MRYVVRLAGSCAGGAREPALLHAHAVDLARSDKRVAARRGLLMAVLCILMCSDQQMVDEETLFATLSLDPRLSRVAEDKADDGRGFAAAVDDFGDQDEAAELLARWPAVVSKDFVIAKLLTREKEKDPAVDPTTGASKEKFMYGIGPAARATVGAFAPLEVVRVLAGASTEQAGAHTRSKTCQLMPKEVGTDVGTDATNIVAFFNHLPQDTFGKEVRSRPHPPPEPRRACWVW